MRAISPQPLPRLSGIVPILLTTAGRGASIVIVFMQWKAGVGEVRPLVGVTEQLVGEGGENPELLSSNLWKGQTEGLLGPS